MSKQNILGVLTLLALWTYPEKSCAHTISQHVQELYGNAYLPLFILASLLPFLGIGLLAGKGKNRKESITIHIPFSVCIALGILLGFYLEIHEFLLVFNRGSILLVGILLVTVKNVNKAISNTAAILLGLTLGIESGLRIDHGMEYRWLYLLILTAGLLIFQLFYNLSIRAHKKNSAFHLISGFTLIILGLIVILLT